VTVLNSSGSALQFSTYLGGSFVDYASGVATTGGSVYITGLTSSIDFPVSSRAFQPRYTGTQATSNAFVSKIDLSPAGFLLSPVPSLETISPGQIGMYKLQISPQGGFAGTIALSCPQGLPPDATCSFSPQSVSVAGAAATSTLSIQTVAPSMSMSHPLRPSRYATLIASLATALNIGGFLFIVVSPRPVYKLGRRLLLAAALGLLLVHLSCGANRMTILSPGTPAGSYKTMVRGVSGSFQSTTTVTLNVQ
jgi:hypothetical protein